MIHWLWHKLYLSVDRSECLVRAKDKLLTSWDQWFCWTPSQLWRIGTMASIMSGTHQVAWEGFYRNSKWHNLKCSLRIIISASKDIFNKNVSLSPGMFWVSILFEWDTAQSSSLPSSHCWLSFFSGCDRGICWASVRCHATSSCLTKDNHSVVKVALVFLTGWQSSYITFVPQANTAHLLNRQHSGHCPF